VLFVALWLTEQGKQVTLVSPVDDGVGNAGTYRWPRDRRSLSHGM
jgi:hypothetical protein